MQAGHTEGKNERRKHGADKKSTASSPGKQIFVFCLAVVEGDTQSIVIQSFDRHSIHSLGAEGRR